MPDFVCIGGQRSGTTWLHHMLNLNPGTVWMPPCKELHHFDAASRSVPVHPYRYREHLASRARHYGLAAARRVTGREIRPDVRVRVEPEWDRRYFLGRRSSDWYRRLFETRAARGKATGEVTPAYSRLPAEEVAGIARDFPDLKVILVMRDPLKRAWSHALLDLPARRAGDADAQTAFLRSPECFERSNWPAIEDRWRAAFPAEQVLVLDFAAIASDPEGFLARVSAHIGADLVLPEHAGDSSRARVASSHRGPAMPDAVRGAVMDLYGPVIAEGLRRHPEIAAGWTGAEAAPARASA